MLPVKHHAVFGAYTCIAENIHGKLEKVLMLTEGAKPGTPSIKPLKIFQDGLELHIEVSRSQNLFSILTSNRVIAPADKLLINIYNLIFSGAKSRDVSQD